MKVVFTPSRAIGEICAPPSKSLAHRALIAGALTGGSSVKGIALSADIEATLSCLHAMGAKIRLDGDTVCIGGLNPSALPANALLPCRESGSTLRFFIPLCLIGGTSVVLTGSDRLMERPLGVYEDICRQQGIALQKEAGKITVCGILKPGEYTVPGDVSSQFITGLLFALPLLPGNSTLTVSGRFESASYVDLTLSVLDTFGIRYVRRGHTFSLPGNQQYRSSAYTVEGDCSNAAFLDGFNLLGGSVKVLNFTENTLQGDRVYREYYRRLITGDKEFDLSDCPDLGPVLFALAAAHGGATFTGTARLRIKESDRSAAMAEELIKCGIHVSVEENRVLVHRGELRSPTEPLYGHNDHRIVMALSLLCSVTGGTIVGAEAVAKSYPTFFDDLKTLQIGLSIHEN